METAETLSATSHTSTARIRWSIAKSFTESDCPSKRRQGRAGLLCPSSRPYPPECVESGRFGPSLQGGSLKFGVVPLGTIRRGLLGGIAHRPGWSESPIGPGRSGAAEVHVGPPVGLCGVLNGLPGGTQGAKGGDKGTVPASQYEHVRVRPI